MRPHRCSDCWRDGAVAVWYIVGGQADGIDFAMPNYRAQYKLDADKGHRLWPLGPFPGKELALEHFNYMVTQENPFKIDEGYQPTDYFLVEQEAPQGEERWFHLVMLEYQ